MRKNYPADVFLVLLLTIAFLLAIGSIQTGNELGIRFLSLLNNLLGLYIAMDRLFPPDNCI